MKKKETLASEVPRTERGRARQRAQASHRQLRRNRLESGAALGFPAIVQRAERTCGSKIGHLRTAHRLSPDRSRVIRGSKARHSPSKEANAAGGVH